MTDTHACHLATGHVLDGINSVSDWLAQADEAIDPRAALLEAETACNAIITAAQSLRAAARAERMAEEARRLPDVSGRLLDRWARVATTGELLKALGAGQ